MYGAKMLAKDMSTGKIPFGTHLLFFPYFALAHGWWLIRHKLVRSSGRLV